jgi:hypothetical protein
MIYSILLFLHSTLRWLILAFAILALVRSAGGGAYTKAHRASSSLFIASLHTNIIIGIVNYAVFSPSIKLALADVGAAMKLSALRFFLLEHPFMMLVAVVIATVGSARIKRGKDDAQKHRRTLVFYGIALALIIAAIPWPFYPAGRPLLPLM